MKKLDLGGTQLRCRARSALPSNRGESSFDALNDWIVLREVRGPRRAQRADFAAPLNFRGLEARAVCSLHKVRAFGRGQQAINLRYDWLL